MTVEIYQEGSNKIADDLRLAADITHTLEKHYPGHLWGVLFNEDGGCVNIICETVQHPLMTNANYAYTLKLSRFDTDPDMKCVVRAGGEILERAGLDRGWFRGEFPRHVDGVKQQHQPLSIVRK